MNSFKNMTEEERIKGAEEFLKSRSDEEQREMGELYRLAERKRSFRRSAVIFAIALLFCILPAVLPFEAMGLTTPAPMVITVFSLLIALVVTVVSIVSFVRYMDAVSKLSDEEKALRGALIYIDMASAMLEAFSTSSAESADNSLAESSEEFIARRNAEKNDISEELPPVSEDDEPSDEPSDEPFEGDENIDDNGVDD